jgi:hypothetical protein
MVIGGVNSQVRTDSVSSKDKPQNNSYEDWANEQLAILTGSTNSTNTISQAPPDARMNQPFSSNSTTQKINFSKVLGSVAGAGINALVAGAAKDAFDKLAGERQCFKVAEETATNSTGIDLRKDGDTSLRGKALTDLDLNYLEPGTHIYMNLEPGTDPQSLNLDNLPHWVTYLGDGKWADNTSPCMTTEELIKNYNNRKIDMFWTPSQHGNKKT